VDDIEATTIIVSSKRAKDRLLPAQRGGALACDRLIVDETSIVVQFQTGAQCAAVASRLTPVKDASHLLPENWRMTSFVIGVEKIFRQRRGDNEAISCPTC
jgi:hypothetical protein